ncbi:xanthine dehydrogenase accessory protein XdhC [Uliginosibacterium sp. H3]|uniref:Xanthine dehydrogenase accessory protein XdhC n=1 Tax=Uliginosibacterium silvisoli TaxID=3114758 RepID=A0ABU6K222_9RHOO|nr:xanthine dehydrogenase accessory protein XdhC [Uliginosibacterium sp. H3]
MNCWRALPGLLEHEDLVLVTVAQTRGSAPREAGTSMLVSLTRTVDTIGGGHLEWEAMAHARAMLLQATSAPALQRLSLGASLGQCCGGVVWLVFERIARASRVEWIERLGVIDGGRALTRELFSHAASQWTICGVDEAARNPGACLDTYHPPSPGTDAPSPSGRGNGNAPARLQQFPLPEGEGGSKSRERGDGARSDTPAIAVTSTSPEPAKAAWHLTHTITPPSFNITLFGAGHVGAAIVNVLATLDVHIRWVDVRDDLFGATPSNVTCIATDAPEEEVDKAPPNSFFLVLTHSHALDLELTARILKRDAFAWFGLIGSRTKRARFEHRLHAQGIAAAQLARMTCPIGVAGIRDKAPQAIAIAVVAQLLQAREHTTHRQMQERAMGKELTHDD